MADPQEYWQLEREYYTITAPSDLVLRVVEFHSITSIQGSTSVVRSVPKKVHEFKVDLATLASSELFNKMLEQESDDVSFIEVHENDAGNVTGLATWLKIIHYIITEDTYELHLFEVWYICSVAMKYGFDTGADKAREWFDGWYNHQPSVKHFNYRDYEQLVYPTWVFDHAVGFAHTTKYLAYRSNGPISEEKPENFRADNAADVYTSPEVMRQLNAARNRLTTVLHRTLYAPIDTLIRETNCNCAPFVLFSYVKGLTTTGYWPLHSALEKNSMKAVVEELKNFTISPVGLTCGRQACTMDMARVVEVAINDIEGQFAGLCLDCMEASSTTMTEGEYWRHEPFGTAWDDGCRVNHTQPSWFFSYLGNRATMNEYLLNKRVQPTNSHGRQRASSYGYGNNAFPRGGAVGHGGSTRGGGTRGGVRNSRRPGRQDSVLSRPHYDNHSYAVQDVAAQLADSTISEVPDQQSSFRHDR